MGSYEDGVVSDAAIAHREALDGLADLRDNPDDFMAGDELGYS